MRRQHIAFVVVLLAATRAPAQDALPEGAVARLGTPRLCLPSTILDAAFTPDGKTFIVVFDEFGKNLSNVAFFDVATGLQRKKLDLFKASRIAVARQVPIIALATDGGYEAWDLAKDKRLQHWPRPDGTSFAEALAISPDGTQLIVATRRSNGATVVLRWNVMDGSTLQRINPDVMGIESISFTADGSKFLTASPNRAAGSDKKPMRIGGAFTVWDAKSGTKIADVSDMPPAMGRIFTILAPNGNTIARGAGENKIDIFDLNSRKSIATITSAHDRHAFTPDSKQLVITPTGQQMVLWDIATNKEVRKFEGYSGAAQHSLPPFVSPDGKLVATCGEFYKGVSRVQVWDIATGNRVHYPAGHSGPVNGLAYSPDGKRLATFSDVTILIFDPETGTELHRWIAHKGTIVQIAFSPAGKTLASASSDGTLGLWDPATGKETRRIAAKDAVKSIAFSRDGKTLISINNKEALQTWDVEKGVMLRTQDVPMKTVSPRLSPNGQFLVWLTENERRREPDGLLHWRNVRGGKALPPIDLRISGLRGFDASFQFSPDGKLFVSTDNYNTVRVWESATRRELVRFSNNPVNTRLLAISPDGQILAHGTGRRGKFRYEAEESIVLRDLASAKSVALPRNPDFGIDPHIVMPFLRPLDGRQGVVHCVTFSPDGKFVATGGADQTVLIWRTDHFFSRTDVAEINAELEDLWAHLAELDASKAYQAIAQLALTPKETVPFLCKRLRPVPKVDDKIVTVHLQNLGSPNFGVRQNAYVALEKLGDRAAHLLQQTAENPPSLEVKRRLELLLDNPLEDVDSLRAYRCLTLLERIGTPDARQLLEELAHGAPGAMLTVEARQSLQRQGTSK